MRLVALALVLACGTRDLTEGRYQGMVELEQTDVGFEVPGRIAALEVAAGARVRAGQVIARLDDAIERETRGVRAAELEAARAELALVLAGTRSEQIQAARARRASAQAAEQVVARQLERERELVAEAASTQSQLDELTAQLAKARGEREVAEASLQELARGARGEEIRGAEAKVTTAQRSLELAERMLAQRVLVAPIAATVVDVHPELGEVIAAGVPVISLVDPARPYADVFVPVGDLPKVRLGGAIALAVEGDPREVPGVIERVYPHLEFTPRFVFSPRERPHLMGRVRVRLDDREHQLHAGQPAYARLALAWEARR